MKRCGSVIVFKEGVSKAKAAEALAKIADVLDLPENSVDIVPSNENTRMYAGGRCVKMVERPFNIVDMVNEFDPKWGGPVWYIP